MSKLYAHSSLDADGDNGGVGHKRIRILHLHPGTREAPLAARIEIIQLDEKVQQKYEALSFTWGIPELSEWIKMKSISTLAI